MATKEKSGIDLAAIAEKVAAWQKKKGVDLSTDEDLAVAVMNLISLEEHFFFTGVKTAKTSYFGWLQEIREMRKSLLAKLIDCQEGETWCASKHLLAATMRLMEVGTKLQKDKSKQAIECFEQANQLFNIFWALRLKLIGLPELKVAAGKDQPWTLQEVVEKLINCCDE